MRLQHVLSISSNDKSAGGEVDSAAEGDATAVTTSASVLRAQCTEIACSAARTPSARSSPSRDVCTTSW
jgi:hypothetical protein